jgi:hypothetical protein
MNQSRSISELVAALPPECQQQVLEFVRGLAERQRRLSPRPPAFDWAGALAELRDRHTSVDLQHQISRWRV